MLNIYISCTVSFGFYISMGPMMAGYSLMWYDHQSVTSNCPIVNCLPIAIGIAQFVLTRFRPRVLISGVKAFNTGEKNKCYFPVKIRGIPTKTPWQPSSLKRNLYMGKYFIPLRFISFLVQLPLFVLLSSCEKDELTKPVEVYFHFKLDRVPQEGSISFQSGTLDLKSITFTGDRASGEDINFTSDFGTVVQADLGTGNSDPVIKFDIPQGTYQQISLSVDPDDNEPDITIIGRYVPALIGPIIPVQLEIDIAGQLNLMAKTLDGDANIVLRKGSRGVVEVFVNPSLWFTDIPLLGLETAELQIIRGVPSILISKDFNPEIYSDLSSLIEVSAEAVFN